MRRGAVEGTLTCYYIQLADQLCFGLFCGTARKIDEGEICVLRRRNSSFVEEIRFSPLLSSFKDV
jgi:hypothetical protein